MTVQLEEEVTEQFDSKWCLHPQKLGDKVVRCYSQDYTYCPSCAALDASRVRAIIESGFKLDEHYTYLFVTLTAPGFSKSKNEYKKLVQWNHNAPRLWATSIKYLSRVLDDVEYVRVAEYQKRGAIHFHAIVRVGENQGIDIVEAVRHMRTYQVDGFKWGRHCDVQQVSTDELSNTEDYSTKNYRQLSYVTSYNIKALGKSLASELTPAQRDHCSKLTEACVELGYTDKAIRGYGYGGQTFTKSKGWSSTTKKSLKEESRQFALEHGSTTDDEQRERIYSRQLAVRDQLLAARGHTGSYRPQNDPVKLRQRLCGSRARSTSHSASEWLTEAQRDRLLLRLNNLEQR